MSGALKVVGWILASLGAMSLMCLPFAAGDGNGSAAMGFGIVGTLFGVPGALLLYAARKLGRNDSRQLLMVGFVRSHDAFTIDELAAHLGVRPEQATMLLSKEIATFQLPLVVHRATGRYLRLDRLQRQAQVADRCQSCGASIGHQIVFEGEALGCQYCGGNVETHVPQPAEQTWRPPAQAGHWAQTQWSGHSHHAPQQPQQPQQPQAYAHQPQAYAQPQAQPHHGHLNGPPAPSSPPAPGGWGRPPGH